MIKLLLKGVDKMTHIAYTPTYIHIITSHILYCKKRICGIALSRGVRFVVFKEKIKWTL